MSPALILSIVATLFIGWYGFYKFTTGFRLNLTADKALKISIRANDVDAKRRIRNEWDVLQTFIRRHANNGSETLRIGHLYPENIRRLRANGFEVIDGVGIQWSKKN